MEKKYYNVYYSNVNLEGEPELAVKEYLEYEINSYIVKEYKKEFRYRKKEVHGLWGVKTKEEKYVALVAKEKFRTYVEEVDGKYYDIITGIEVIPEIEVYDWTKVEIREENYQYYDKKLPKDNVESKSIKFTTKNKATSLQVYRFLTSLSSWDIKLYCQKMEQARINAEKVQEKRMSMLLQKANDQKMHENYISSFRENNGIGKTRTR